MFTQYGYYEVKREKESIKFNFELDVLGMKEKSEMIYSEEIIRATNNLIEAFDKINIPNFSEIKYFSKNEVDPIDETVTGIMITVTHKNENENEKEFRIWFIDNQGKFFFIMNKAEFFEMLWELVEE